MVSNRKTRYDLTDLLVHSRQFDLRLFTTLSEIVFSGQWTELFDGMKTKHFAFVHKKEGYLNHKSVQCTYYTLFYELQKSQNLGEGIK